MYQYRPQNEDELELREGDWVDVMQQCDDGWFVGMWAWRVCWGVGWKDVYLRVLEGRARGMLEAGVSGSRGGWGILVQHIHLLAWLSPQSQHFCCCLHSSKRNEAQVTD